MQTFNHVFKIDLGGPSSDTEATENERGHIPRWHVERDCDTDINGWLERTLSGTLLLTGYRGVGKSSCVEKALDKIYDKNKEQIELATIKINFTTMFTLATLSMLIVKQIVEKLGLEISIDSSQKVFFSKQNASLKKLSSSDPAKVRGLKSKIEQFLIQASARVETALNLGGHSASFLGVSATEGVIATQKNLFNQMTESEIVLRLNDIINDYVQLIGAPGIGIKRISFIFDEIDKLKGFYLEDDKDEDKIKKFEELIGKLKYVFTNSKAIYIFIAGREIYHRWQIDKSRGNSVYSSVFDHVLFVEPFLGCDNKIGKGEVKETELQRAENKIREIIKKYLLEKYPTWAKKHTDTEFASLEEKDVYKSFIRYLLWKSRGIPRKILQELEYFIQPVPAASGASHLLYFDTDRIRKIKFYSGLVKELYSLTAANEKLDNDGILNLIILTETLFKFHRTGFNYSDLKWITVSVDQEVELNNEHYFDLAIKLLEGWWVETSYGKKARYVFKPHSKAAINILSTTFQDESVAFKFEKKDFKNAESYFTQLDQLVENQTDSQRVNSIRIQMGIGKISALLKNDFQAIEFYKKAIRLGIIELQREKDSVACTGNTRVLTRAMADCYIEIGHIFEKQRSLREAMSFYLSAFVTAYKSHENLADTFQIDLSEITGNISKESLESYFSIGEEAVDALTHVAYIQWKFGRLRETERLFRYALELARKRSYPYKIASQSLLLGFFFFRCCESQKALEVFRKIVAHYENDPEISQTPLPDFIINSTQEAISCCILSDAEDVNGLKKSFNELERIFFRVDSTVDLRQVIEFKLLKFRLYQRILRAEEEKKITDSTHIQLLNNLFLLVRKRSSDTDYIKENPISVRLYFHLTGMVCWHMLLVVTHKIDKNRKENENNPNAFKLPEKHILECVNELLKECYPFFQSISDKCIKSMEAPKSKRDSGNSYFYSYLDNKDFEQTPDETIFKKIINGLEFTSLRELFLFLEQVFLLCHRVFHKNIFTAAASDPADRLGYFYFWIYTNFSNNGNSRVPELEFNALKEETIETFFNFSFSDQQVYKKYLPDQAFPNITSQLFLADLYYLRLNRDTQEDKVSLQQKCLHFYTIAMLSLASELQINFTKTSLMHTIFYKETKMIPRLRMYDIAEQRYRLRGIYLKNKDEINGHWQRINNFFSKFPQDNERPEKKYERLELNNSDCVHIYCSFLKKVANTKRESTGGSEGPNNASLHLNKSISILRDIIKPWRYREDLTSGVGVSNESGLS